MPTSSSPPLSSQNPAPHALIVGLGYVGKPLGSALMAAGFQVTGLVRDPSRADLPFPILPGDLTQPETLLAAAQKLLSSGRPPEIVIHCAASGRGGGEAAYQAVYRDGVLHLSQAFPSPASRLLFTSSTSVYPQIDGSVITEDSEAEPTRGNGRILREAEKLTLDSGGIVTRLAGIYGPGRSVLLRNFLAGLATIDCRTEPPATPDGRWINQIHQQDILSAIIHLLKLPAPLTAGQIFNLTDSRPYTQREIYTEMVSEFGGQLPPTAPPALDRKRGWSHKRVSNARIRSTGWEPAFPSFFHACTGDPQFLPSILGEN